MKQNILLTIFFLVTMMAMAQKKNQVKIAKIEVLDRPVIVWVNYPKDTTEIAQNIQVLSAVIKSRVPLRRIEIRLNGITSEVYDAADFSKPLAPDQYEQSIEPSLAFRTGINSIVITAINSKGITAEGSRRVIVDPNKISILRSEKDHSNPMIFVSDPVNQKEYVVVYSDGISLKGTVLDESGIQQLKINGSVVPVKENGAYVVYLPLNVGENPVTIEAKDLNQNIGLKKFVIERKNPDGSAYNFAEAKNYLLVIGINEYTSWPTLNNAVSDGNLIRNVLTTNYKFDSTNVSLIVNAEATRSNIINKLRTYIEQITARDNLLIYFSGHGYFDKLLSEGYWVPVDAGRNDLSDYISNSQILKIIENINSQHTFLVVDACFSGSLFASSRRGLTDQVEKYKSRWGLASGRLEMVTDGEIGANSPFAIGFAEFLLTNADDKANVSDLVQFVKKRVSEKTDQTPIGNPLKSVGDEGGEFIFYRRNPSGR
jgi:Caspase domain/Glucodextranase, domain B